MKKFAVAAAWFYFAIFLIVAYVRVFDTGLFLAAFGHAAAWPYHFIRGRIPELWSEMTPQAALLLLGLLLLGSLWLPEKIGDRPIFKRRRD
jgi:hypothetical protein